jgi:hypothetical protein
LLQEKKSSVVLFQRMMGVLSILVLLCVSLTFGQTVSNSLLGTLTDPANAVVPGAEVQLTDQATGAVRSTQSNSVGLFRFPSLPPGLYTIAVKSLGFKIYEQKQINLSASETRGLGRLLLELGSVVEQMSATAEATPVQTAGSEKSALVEGAHLNTIALKGRDVFGFLARFDATGQQISATFGAYNAVRRPRIIAFARRFEF